MESKVVPYKDASRSEQREEVWFLIAGGEFKVDIYQRIEAVQGEHCLDQVSGNSWCISKGQQMISDLHENVRPHVGRETKATL
ncbi:hypothetical protein TNCV_1877461 [Trichonephila clavipes]|nr:hypothetical protein TNCV_1877461 [Trichonephila clavipes]